RRTTSTTWFAASRQSRPATRDAAHEFPLQDTRLESRMEDITMTEDELEALQQELRRLESDGRREIADRIKTAREWGDLKENAEYHAAKEDQAHLETRILKLREQVRRAAVVEVNTAGDVVEHGSTVSYTDRASGRTQTFKI